MQQKTTHSLKELQDPLGMLSKKFEYFLEKECYMTVLK
jgi:hypothetical protein